MHAVLPNTSGVTASGSVRNVTFGCATVVIHRRTVSCIGTRGSSTKSDTTLPPPTPVFSLPLHFLLSFPGSSKSHHNYKRFYLDKLVLPVPPSSNSHLCHTPNTHTHTHTCMYTRKYMHAHTYTYIHIHGVRTHTYYITDFVLRHPQTTKSDIIIQPPSFLLL